MKSTDRSDLHVLVAGPLDQRTGGYRYDAHMVQGLRDSGWRVQVHELPGRWPEPSAEVRRDLDDRLAAVPDGITVVIDGLVGGSTPRVLERHADRLTLIALVHHPLADEEGCSRQEEARRTASESRTLDAVAGVIVTSTFTARRLRDFEVDPDRIRIVEPGTASVESPTDPPPDPSDAEATGAAGEGLRDIPPVLLCLGSVVPRKDQITLVGALARITDAPWRCEIVGSLQRDPDYADSLRKRVEEAGLTHRIDLAGEIEEAALERAWHRADVFVLPSRYEGYGMAFTEAMMRGLPVLGTTGGAIPDTVPPDVGRLVVPGDTDALADELRRVIIDADLRRTMADASRRHAAGLPDWPEQVSRFAQAVGELEGG